MFFPHILCVSNRSLGLCLIEPRSFFLKVFNYKATKDIIKAFFVLVLWDCECVCERLEWLLLLVVVIFARLWGKQLFIEIHYIPFGVFELVCAAVVIIVVASLLNPWRSFIIFILFKTNFEKKKKLEYLKRFECKINIITWTNIEQKKTVIKRIKTQRAVSVDCSVQLFNCLIFVSLVLFSYFFISISNVIHSEDKKETQRERERATDKHMGEFACSGTTAKCMCVCGAWTTIRLKSQT